MQCRCTDSGDNSSRAYTLSNSLDYLFQMRLWNTSETVRYIPVSQSLDDSPNMGRPPPDTAGVNQHAEEVIQDKPKRSWKSYVWDTFDKSPEERRFLFKLDAAVLTFASLGYLIKYLDQTNINSAFVSGMKEDLGLYGNQLNYMQTCWTIGYVIGEIPSNLILTRIRPSIWIPTLEVIWTVLTFCLSQANNAETIYAIRFLVGLAESGFYPGMQFLIGSWYRRDELAKRSCIFHVASPLAQMVRGSWSFGVH